MKGLFLLRMQLLFVVLFSMPSVQVASASGDIFARIYTNAANGSLHINPPGNGTLLIKGSDPLAMVDALEQENDRLKNMLTVVQNTVAGLGTKQWTYQRGGSGDDRALGTATDEDGHVIVVGDTTGVWDDGSSKGGTDYWVAKFDSDGTKLWSIQDGTSEEDAAMAAATDAQGNVFVAGLTYGVMAGSSNAGVDTPDMFVIKYSGNGVKQWTRQIGSPNWDRAFAATTDGNGSVIVVGSTEGTIDGHPHMSGEEIFVIKLNNSDGSTMWSAVVRGNSHQQGNGVDTDVAGNIYVTAHFAGTVEKLDGSFFSSAGSWDSMVAKFNSNGVRQWTRVFGTTAADILYNSATDPDGNTYAIGGTGGDLDGQTRSGGGGTDLFVVKYDTNGVKLWTRLHGTSALDKALDVAVAPGGKFVYITGVTEGGLADGSTNSGSTDIILSKFSHHGEHMWTRQYGASGVDDTGEGVATDSKGNIFVCGYTEDTMLKLVENQGGKDMFLIKFGLE